MFGFGRKKKYEQEMAEWLAHPLEFGVPPKSVRYKRTYKVDMPGDGPVEIHLVEYVMPDGTRGCGFVNGSLTWSFIGEEVNAIDEGTLFVAYCGWAWLFPAVQAGRVVTEFVSEGEEARYIAQRKEEGFTDITITSRYKIGTSEVFEYTAKRNGRRFKGAGDTSNDLAFEEGDPCFNLPPIYFLLGTVVCKSMR